MSLPGFLSASRAMDTGGAAPQANVLDLSMTCQQATFWCWAAVTQSVELHFGSDLSQEDIATEHIGNSQPGTTCTLPIADDADSLCDTICRGSCNSPHALSVILAERGRLSGSATAGCPGFEAIVAAIRGTGNPMPARIEWGDGNGHFICIIGYSDGGPGQQFVTVLDPMMPGIGRGEASVRQIPYATFSRRYTLYGQSGKPNFYYEV